MCVLHSPVLYSPVASRGGGRAQGSRPILRMNAMKGTVEPSRRTTLPAEHMYLHIATD